MAATAELVAGRLGEEEARIIDDLPLSIVSTPSNATLDDFTHLLRPLFFFFFFLLPTAMAAKGEENIGGRKRGVKS